MRRALPTLIFTIVAFSLLLAACSPSAVSTPAPEATQAIEPTKAPEPTTASNPENTGMLPEIDPSTFSGDIYAAGSSTVYPVSEMIVELFKAEGFEGQGNIKLDSIGSGAGFERFCVTGETDIANASRSIKDSEIESCKAINRNPIEFRVGTDALAIVVNKNNTFLTHVTLDELGKIFSDEAELWSDVNASWPSEPIKRYVPGTDSGTFDFFIEAVSQKVFEKETAEEKFLQAANLQASEDDNVLVQGVAGDEYSIGFFGYAFYQENKDTLNILSVDGITPSFDTAESGEYPLSRPLYIYSDAGIINSKPQVSAFINFYLTFVNDIIGDAGYFPASEEALNQAKQAYLDALK